MSKSNGHESTQFLRGADQITVDQLIGATSTAVLRAVKEQESRLQGPLNVTPILVGLLPA